MGRLMSKKRRRKQSDIHQEDIEILSEEGFEDAEGEEEAESFAEVEQGEAESSPEVEQGEADFRDAELEEADSEEEDSEQADDAEETDSEEDEFEEENSEEDLGDIDLEEDELENEGDKREKRRRRRRRRAAKKDNEEKKSLGKKPWIIAGSIAGGLLVIYLGISAFFIGHFFINTTINGKDFSGKSAADVEEYLKDQVKDYELELIELNNTTDVIKGSDISLVYKEDSSVEDALKKQNPILWVTSLFSKSSQNVNIKVDYDENELEEKIQSIKAVTQEQTEPTSAYPKFDGDSFVVEPEVYGTAVNIEVLSEKIKEHITEFNPTLDMLEEECYKLPKYTSESPEVQAACDTMNQYCKASITYPMTENVVVDKNLISTWLTYDDNMQVTFNEDAVREWMRNFGATYDTVGATRTITSPNGKTVEVSGGTYGWSIDEETEAQNLINSIKNGEVATREPAYAQTAASHSAQDWGTTFIEVDLSAQHMWYIVDGSIAFQADVVTGLPTPNRATPSGVYSILYTERNATLVGEKDPATGEPIYRTPVSYWMPFTWQGHGFHDATWQPGFGGNLYQSLGSHGCVNMSYSDAGTLFGMISAGTPVVLHY
jgi:lipoprotein-anchoring transpeptidase ErfK/SrfK